MQVSNEIRLICSLVWNGSANIPPGQYGKRNLIPAQRGIPGKSINLPPLERLPGTPGLLFTPSTNSDDNVLREGVEMPYSRAASRRDWVNHFAHFVN